MSVIAGVREFIQTCPYLSVLDEISVDRTGDHPVCYGIFPGGDRLISAYIDGTEKRQYSFALYLRHATAADLERIDNAEFLENFCNWVADQSAARRFPALGERMTATAMETANGFLYDMDENGMSGLYQVQCQLYYTRAAR